MTDVGMSSVSFVVRAPTWAWYVIGALVTVNIVLQIWLILLKHIEFKRRRRI